MRSATPESLRVLGAPLLSAFLCAFLALGCGTRDPGTFAEPAAETSAAEVPVPAPAEDNLSAGAAEPTLEAELPVAEREMARREAELAARETELAERESALKAAERRARPAPPVRETPPPAPAVPDPEPEPVVAEAAPPPAPLVEPEPVPEPRRTIALTVPEGTVVEVEFLDGVGSATSEVGDRFAARLVRDVAVGGRTAIPAGSRVLGTVTEARALRAVGGQARLGLSFDRLEFADGGEPVSIRAGFASEGHSETRRDAATIGGATAGGAVLGRVLAGRDDRKKGTVLGALAGAAVGAAIASRTPGEEVEIPAGTAVDLRLEEWVRVLVEE